MRIELSPWERTELSLPNKRRRQPGSGPKLRTEDKTSCPRQPVAISFVPGLQPARPSKKPRKSGFSDKNIIPLVVVTAEDRIVTVGTKRSSEGSFSVAESQILQYSSRPNVRFLPMDAGLPCLSAVLHSEHERFFCLQKDNLRLISWEAVSTPDEAPYHSFDEPALALSLLDFEHNPIVCGTLRNGALFVATCDEKGMKTKLFETSLPSKAQHVGTFAQMTGTGEEIKNRKHSLTSTSDSGNCFFYQIFIDRKDLVVVRRLVSGLVSFEPIEGEFKQTRISLSRPAGETVESASMIGMVERDQTVLLGLRIGTDTLVVSVSMITGNLVKTGYRIPPETGFSSVASDCVLLSCSDTDFYLMDASRGATLLRNPLNDVFSEKIQGKPLLLVSGANKSYHVVLAEDSEGAVVFAMRSASVFSHFRLADSLSLAQTTSSLRPQNLVVGTLSKGNAAANSVQSNVCKALAMLETACAFLRTHDGKKAENNFLQQAFIEASNLFLRNTSANPHENLKHQSTDNMKGIIESSNGSKMLESSNGNKMNGVPVGRGLNGISTNRIAQDSLHNFAELPSAFLNEAAFMISNLLVSLPQNTNGIALQCTQILKEILHSRKFNARVLLRDENGVPGFVTKLCLSIRKCLGEGDRSYSSTHFVFDLVRCCKDLTESQFANLVHFLLLSEEPKNISAYLVSMKCVGTDDPLGADVIALSRRYLALCDKEMQTETEKVEIQLLCAKLVVSVVLMLCVDMAGFSELNGVLLRRSLAEQFSKEELTLLIRLLPRLVASVGTRTCVSKRLLQIISALCDCITIFGSLTEEEQSVIQTLVDIVDKEASFTQELIPFHVALQELPTELELEKFEAQQMQSENFPSQIAEYQIERLVL